MTPKDKQLASENGIEVFCNFQILSGCKWRLTSICTSFSACADERVCAKSCQPGNASQDSLDMYSRAICRRCPPPPRTSSSMQSSQIKSVKGNVLQALVVEVEGSSTTELTHLTIIVVSCCTPLGLSKGHRRKRRLLCVLASSGQTYGHSENDG